MRKKEPFLLDLIHNEQTLPPTGEVITEVNVLVDLNHV